MCQLLGYLVGEKGAELLAVRALNHAGIEAVHDDGAELATQILVQALEQLLLRIVSHSHLPSTAIRGDISIQHLPKGLLRLDVTVPEMLIKRVRLCADNIRPHANRVISVFSRPRFGRGDESRADATATHPFGHYQAGDFSVGIGLEDARPAHMKPADDGASIVGHEDPPVLAHGDRPIARRDLPGGGRVAEYPAQFGHRTGVFRPHVPHDDGGRNGPVHGASDIVPWRSVQQ